MSARAELQAKLAERDRIASEIAGHRKRAAGLQSRAENAEARTTAERASAAEADALAMAEDRKPASRKADLGADAGREAVAARRAAELAEAEIPALEQALGECGRGETPPDLAGGCVRSTVPRDDAGQCAACRARAPDCQVPGQHPNGHCDT